MGVCGEAWRTECSEESDRALVGRGLCKRFGFCFNETAWERSVRIQSYLCYLKSFRFVRLLVRLDFPGGSVVENPPASARDTGLIPESERSPAEGSGSPFRCSCLGISRGQRILVDCSPWGCKESDVSERMYTRVYQQII